MVRINAGKVGSKWKCNKQGGARAVGMALMSKESLRLVIFAAVVGAAGFFAKEIQPADGHRVGQWPD
jgi:hypothetical protein